MRIYLERHDLTSDPTAETAEALVNLLAAADEPAGITRHTGRTAPTVAT